jgi:hypothetical protein
LNDVSEAGGCNNAAHLEEGKRPTFAKATVGG